MKKLLIALVALSALTMPTLSGACDCPPLTAKEGLKYSGIVFRGELIKRRGSFAVFRVDEQWKGDLGSYVELEWRDGSQGDCDGFWPWFLRVGNKLLVFGTRDARGFYRTSICLPTTFISDAEEFRKKLGPGKSPRKD